MNNSLDQDEWRSQVRLARDVLVMTIDSNALCPLLIRKAAIVLIDAGCRAIGVLQ